MMLEKRKENMVLAASVVNGYEYVPCEGVKVLSYIDPTGVGNVRTLRHSRKPGISSAQ